MLVIRARIHLLMSRPLTDGTPLMRVIWQPLLRGDGMSLPALGVELRTEPAAQAQVHKFHRQPRNSGLARSLDKWAAAKREVGSGVTWEDIYKHFGECLTVVMDGGGLLLLILLLRGFSGTGPLVRVLLGIRTPFIPSRQKKRFIYTKAISTS